MAADPGQIQQVLTNLCLNARDAIAETGIDLATRTRYRRPVAADRPRPGRPAGYVEIAVDDTGEGMDEQTLRRVFDPFFTTKPKDQGTGLGLAIVYRDRSGPWRDDRRRSATPTGQPVPDLPAPGAGSDTSSGSRCPLAQRHRAHPGRR